MHQPGHMGTASPASQTRARRDQENACVLYSWICLNIDMYRRDKYRLYPGSRGRHNHPPHAHTAFSIPHHPRGYCSSICSPARCLLPCSCSRFGNDVVFVHTQHFMGFQDGQTTGNDAEQPKNKVQWLQKVWLQKTWLLLFFMTLLCAFESPQVWSNS